MSSSASPFSSLETGAAVEGRGAELPLLDLAVLRSLEDQVKEPLARNFAKDYITMWESRCRRLTRALADPDAREKALDSVISIKVSSAMIGALRLARLAASVEEQIRAAALPEAVSALPAVTECGKETIQELRLRYAA